MALIKCNECGKEVSENAPICPNCGNNLRSTNYVVPTIVKVLSFLFPIVGLIIFIINIGKNDKLAKSAGKCAIFGTIFCVLLSGILLLIIYFLTKPVEVPVTNNIITIPDITNMTVDEGSKILKEKGFEVSKEVESIFDEKIAKGMIVRTSPSIGRSIKKGTEITIYVSSGDEHYVIEDYTGKNYIEMKTILVNNYGLNVVIEKKEISDGKKYDAETIIDQDLKAGTKVSKGDNITLYIPGLLETYPDFTDGTWTKSMIESFCNSYELKCEIKEEKDSNYLVGTIISQSRPKGDKIEKGAELTIKMS